MNKLDQLRLHVLALATAVEQNNKFFASIIHYVQQFKKLVTSSPSQITQTELQLLARKIEEFYRRWRPSGDGIYIPPRETADTDSTVQEINQLVTAIAKMTEEEFQSLIPKPTRQAVEEPALETQGTPTPWKCRGSDLHFSDSLEVQGVRPSFFGFFGKGSAGSAGGQTFIFRILCDTLGTPWRDRCGWNTKVRSITSPVAAMRGTGSSLATAIGPASLRSSVMLSRGTAGSAMRTA